jgi:hypothetical protein
VGWRAGVIADGGGQAVAGDGDRAGRVPATVALEQLDQGDALAIGQGQGGDADRIVVFSEDEAAGPGWGGRPPSGYFEGLSCRVSCL